MAVRDSVVSECVTQEGRRNSGSGAQSAPGGGWAWFAGCLAVAGITPFAILVWGLYGQLYGYVIADTYLLGNFLLLLLALACIFLGLPGGAILLFWPTTRRLGVILLFACPLFLISMAVGVHESNRLRMRAFHALAERSTPLVEAIADYEKTHGKPPDTLGALVPEWLDAVPGTGLGVYPRYEYVTGEEAVTRFGNSWALLVQTSRGLVNWDLFMYFPRQNYPDRPTGDNRIERVGDWAYLHE